jgi:hypothetical protein
MLNNMVLKNLEVEKSLIIKYASEKFNKKNK